MHLRFLRLLAAALALLLIVPAFPSAAAAQEDDDEIDDGGVDAERPSRQRTRKKRRKPVREVVKGFYLKANVGPQIWLPPISAWTSSTATAADISIGYDFVDKLNFTMTVEVSFMQLISNGTGVSDPAYRDTHAPSPIQGDFRVFGGLASLRIGPNFGGRKVKRANISLIVGGGVATSPALVDVEQNSVANLIASNTFRGIMQGGVLGVIAPGLGIEYYTKLSHFSVGLDIDYNIILGAPVVAMGLGLDFFFKYTF